MCGRFVLKEDPEGVRALFGYVDTDPFLPRYNIAPTQPIAVVRQEHGVRRLALVRWGLVPAWVKDPGDFSLIINARAEGVADKPAYKYAMRYRRCLVPASGFYEWRKGKGTVHGPRQAYWIHPKQDGPIAFAGLWETWADRDGSEIDSGCIVTTPANDTVAPVHDRMPAIIAPEDFETWLTGDEADALALLKSAPTGLLEAVQVGDRVNKADNDDPGLIEPVTPMRVDLFDP